MKYGPAMLRVLWGVSAFCLVSCLTGCDSIKDYTVTGHLWDNNALINHRQPSTNVNNIRLYQNVGSDDVLVQYDEERERNGAIKRRAYFLNANNFRVDSLRKPRFTRLREANGMELIPSAIETSAGSNTAAGIRATLATDGGGFTLYRNGKEVGSYRLPTYPDGMSEAKRLLLTPPAVTADAAIWASIGGAIVWLRFGCPTRF